MPWFGELVDPGEPRDVRSDPAGLRAPPPKGDEASRLKGEAGSCNFIGESFSLGTCNRSKQGHSRSEVGIDVAFDNRHAG